MAESIESYWDLVEPIFSTVDLDGSDKFRASIRLIPRPILLLYAAHFCLSEVRNGGFFQFFWNSTGLIAPEAVEGFHAIGMTKLASVVETAAAPLGLPFPRDRDGRWDAMLAASGRDEDDLKRIFEGNSNFYLAFEEAAKPLSFDALNKQAWALADLELEGFEESATRYAQSLRLVQ